MNNPDEPNLKGQAPSFRDEEVQGHRAAYVGRGYALIGVAILTGILSPWPAPVYIWSLLLLFFANGYLAYRVADARWSQPWHHYVIVLFDFALLTFTLIYPNPLAPIDLPPQVNLRFGNFVYFFILLSSLAYIYRPRLVVWGGVSGAICWTLGVIWLLARPGAKWREPDNANVETYLTLIGDPNFIDLDVRLQEIGVFLLTAGLLALGVSRMRAIAMRQVEFAEQRANLARYFPQQTAAHLANKSNPFTTPKEQKAAVMFADIVGFTAWSEQQPPKQTIAYLREMQGMLAEIIFKWDGTLDKFIGDGLMATFGTASPGSRDATNALQAAVEMADSFDQWRKKLSEEAGGNLKLSIGLQYGTVVVGDVGSQSRMEFATLGDVVNVASRLEEATREHSCRVLAGDALIKHAIEETGKEADALVESFGRIGSITIEGRAARETAYCYR